MSIEMLPFVLAGFQLGALGLVAMLLNGRMAAIQADQREIRSDLKVLTTQQHQDYKDLSAKIDQVLMALKSREPA